MTKQLIINSQNLEIIYHHAQQIYPEECCGLLVGKVEQNKKEVVKVIPTENNWLNDAKLFNNLTPTNLTIRSKRDSFSIAPQTLLQVQKEARKLNLDITGIYHSHPDYPSIPSDFDRAIAWEGYSYIIVSVLKGEIKELFSWTLSNENEWISETIIQT
jgi:proteasome lid subunit RPN8/RPN11